MGSQSWNSVGWCQQTYWLPPWAVWEAPSLQWWLISGVMKWARRSDSGCPGSKPPYMIIHSLSGYNNPFPSARRPCCLQRNMCRSETDLPKQVFRVKNINTTCSRGAVDFTPANVRHPALLSPTVGPQPRSGFPNQTQLETENALTAACHMLSLANQPLLSLRLYISVYVYIGVKSETQ